MRMSKTPIRGVIAPAPRPTFAGALWLALLLAIPVALTLWTLEVLWRLLW